MATAVEPNENARKWAAVFEAMGEVVDPDKVLAGSFNTEWPYDTDGPVMVTWTGFKIIDRDTAHRVIGAMHG